MNAWGFVLSFKWRLQSKGGKWGRKPLPPGALKAGFGASRCTVWRKDNSHSSHHNFLLLDQRLAGLSTCEQLQSHISNTGYVSRNNWKGGWCHCQQQWEENSSLEDDFCICLSNALIGTRDSQRARVGHVVLHHFLKHLVNTICMSFQTPCLGRAPT
jgi:hypothetical protein